MVRIWPMRTHALRVYCESTCAACVARAVVSTGNGGGYGYREGFVASRLVRRAGGGLVLAMSVPGIALAATASFTSKTPAPGSSSTNAKPTISVMVSDSSGVRYMRNILLSLDGHRVTPTVKYSAGFGFRKFKMSFAVPANLSVGSHSVKVYVKDRSGQASRTSWSFTVAAGDVTPPVTTSNAAALEYGTSATILLFATDNAAARAWTTPTTCSTEEPRSRAPRRSPPFSGPTPSSSGLWTMRATSRRIMWSDFALIGASSFAHDGAGDLLHRARRLSRWA